MKRSILVLVLMAAAACGGGDGDPDYNGCHRMVYSSHSEGAMAVDYFDGAGDIIAHCLLLNTGTECVSYDSEGNPVPFAVGDLPSECL